MGAEEAGAVGRRGRPWPRILRLFQVFFEKSEEKVSLRLTGVVCGYLLRS